MEAGGGSSSSGREGGLNRRVGLSPYSTSQLPLSYSASRTSIQGAAKTPLRIFLPHNVSLTQGKTGRTEHHKHKCLKSSSFLLNRFCAPSPIQHPVPHLNRRRFTLPPRSPTLIPHPRANLPPCNQRQNLRLTALPIPNSTIAPHFTLLHICTLLQTQIK